MDKFEYVYFINGGQLKIKFQFLLIVSSHIKNASRTSIQFANFEININSDFFT